MSSWVTWVLVGLVAVGLLVVWQGLEGPALVLEGQKISHKEFTKLYENLVAQYQRAYAQYGQDFSKLLQGPAGIEYRLELQSRVVDDLLRRRLIALEIERRHIVILSSDVDDQTEIAFERILKQNNITEEQAAQILKKQGRTLESFKRELRQAVELNIKTERLRESVVGPIEPTDQELSVYLEEHREEYDTPEEVHARHILIRVPENASEAEIAHAKKQIEDIQKELENGADFAELAKKYSQDSGSAQNGGDLGWFRRGQMVQEFEDVAFSLEPGQVSDPVRTQFGFHVIKVEEKKPAQHPELAQIRDRVLKDYIESERTKRFEKFYSELKAQAKIFIADPVLRIFYLFERADRLEEAQHEYAKLTDPNQKLHIARVLQRKLETLGSQADPELVLALKEEIIQVWLAQMAVWPNRADRSYGVSRIIALKPNELPGEAFFQIAVGAGALDETLRVLQRRLKEYGVRESVVLAVGDEQIVVWARTERADAVERLIGVRGQLELKRVLREGAVGERLRATGLGEQALTDRAEAAKPGSGRYYLVSEAPVIDALEIKDVSVQTNPAGRPAVVRVRLSANTVHKLAKALQTDQTLAIVIDNVVYGTIVMGASLRELLSQRGSVFDVQVEDEASVEEAQALALALRIGPLPTPVRVARP